jgi:predicted HicB family RNase H-like nuclease
MHGLVQNNRALAATSPGQIQESKSGKGGRSKLPKGAGYSQPIQVRLREEDYKAFQQAAKSNGQTLSQWIRASLRAAATSQEILIRLVQ